MLILNQCDAKKTSMSVINLLYELVSGFLKGSFNVERRYKKSFGF